MTSYAKSAPCLFLFILIANCDVVEINKESYAKEVKEALSEVHKLLDDDHSGSIDSLESKEFLREELQYADERQKDEYFHGNDPSISIEDLERAWLANPVRNWTANDVINWINTVVQLPEYSDAFRRHSITGNFLPLIANRKRAYLRDVLKIVNKKHRNKIELKAIDAILFGPLFERGGNVLKDFALVVSLLAVGFLFLYTRQVKSVSRKEMKKMMEDMETLQQAEKELKLLQQKLSEDQPDEKSLVDEAEVEDQRKVAEELHEVRAALAEAHSELAQRNSFPPELKQWLQISYDREKTFINERKKRALEEMEIAKEGCQKLSKKRGSFFGTFRLAHGHQFEIIDQKIIKAKEFLRDVVEDLHEHRFRWQRIEALSGCRVSSVSSPTATDCPTHVLGRSASDPLSIRKGTQTAAITNDKKSLGFVPEEANTQCDSSDTDSLGKSNPASSTSSLTSLTSASTRSRPVVRLGDIGKRNSDPSLLGRSADSGAAASFYRIQAEYAKDYNSLACANLPSRSLDSSSMGESNASEESEKKVRRRSRLWLKKGESK